MTDGQQQPTPPQPPAQPQPSPPQPSSLDRSVHWLLRHWLVVVNILVLLYGGLPWLAPLAIDMGYPDLGNWLFSLYTPLCHQSPQNSPFLFGQQVAICNREAAMYGALALGGLLFMVPPVRRFFAYHPLSMALVVVLVAPLVIDGLTQTLDAAAPALGLRDPDDSPGSFNWWMRVGTGVLFAVAVVTGIYPRLDRDLRGPPPPRTPPAPPTP